MLYSLSENFTFIILIATKGIRKYSFNLNSVIFEFDKNDLINECSFPLVII